MSNQSRLLKPQLSTTRTIEDLTGVFEHIASAQIRDIRLKVLNSKLFFNELWEMYSQLRVDAQKVGRQEEKKAHKDNLAILITSPLGLAGDSDERIITKLIANSAKQQDIMVIGSHGASLLKRQGIKPIRSFEVPDVRKPFEVTPLIDVASKYRTTTVYYESYLSLTVQEIGQMDLQLKAQPLTEDDLKLIKKGTLEVITPSNFIFEPSIHDVLSVLERAMLNTTLTQLLLESRLAQLATRFTSMTVAHQRAHDQRRLLNLRYMSMRRGERDETTRQIMAAVRLI